MPGPDLSADNFESHLKNKNHRVTVEERMAKEREKGTV
jgi:hypothetical protein